MLGGTAATIGTAIAGGAAFAALTGPAASASVTISNTSVQTDDGDLSYVDVDMGDFYAVWDGFDVPVAAVAFVDTVTHVGGPSGGSGDSHVLYDQRGVDAQPVLLADISSQGSGSDGWGGPGEYASTFDTKTAPDTSVVNQPGSGGPTEARAGYVHADVLWRIVSDDLSAHPAHSIEDPAVLGTDLPAMDNPDDGTTHTHTLELTKEVYFYTLQDNGNSPLTATDGSTSVYPMGADDGTMPKVEATPAFDVDVVNQASTSSTDGSGTSTSG